MIYILSVEHAFTTFCGLVIPNNRKAPNLCRTELFDVEFRIFLM